MKHIADRAIGYRSCELLLKKYKTTTKVVKQTKISRKNLHAWKTGECVPSVYYLQYFLQLGLDVIYILSGKEEKK